MARADLQLRAIDAAANGLTEFPLSGVARDSLFPGIRSVAVNPTVIFYRIAQGAIEIVRVVDGRRNLATLFHDEGKT
jgi:toxin ParE1/3/4